jgi:hypothetical protein
MTAANGVQIRMRSAALGFLIGSALSVAIGTWVLYWNVLPGFTRTDEALRADFSRLEGRFGAMVIRFDGLDGEEKAEMGLTATTSALGQTNAALIEELRGHLHANDGRMDGHDTRMQQLQQDLTAMRSSIDALCRASVARACGR